MKKWILVDVEARGQSPVNGTMTEFGAVDFETRKTFHGKIYEGTPDPANPAIPVVGKQIRRVQDVMCDFSSWLDELAPGRPIFISDNPAYDWQWISGAFDFTLIPNPFGHSARRISDFWAGLNYDFGDTQSWKKFRKTIHDHNPVNDSMGNAEALKIILELAKEKRLSLIHI